MSLAKEHLGLGRYLIFVYGAAHFGKSLLWNASVLIFAFFLTEIVGMKPEQMGYVLGLSMVVNAILDISIGYFLSRFVRDQYSASRWQCLGAGLAALLFIAFSCTALVPEEYRVWYSLVTVLGFRVGYSLYDVPQNAYMAFATKNDSVRAKFAATRYIAAGAALVMLTLLFSPIIRAVDTESQALTFASISIVLSCISLFFSLALMLFTRRYCRVYIHVNKSLTPQKALPKAIQTTPKLYLVLLISIFSLSFVSTAFSKLEAYFTAFGIHDAYVAVYFMTLVALGKVTFQPLWVYLSNRVGLLKNLQTASISLACSCLLFYCFASAGGVSTLAVAFLYGSAWGGVAMSLWSLLAKVSSSSPSKTTKQYGAFTFCSKIGKSICVLVLGQALASFDYKNTIESADILISIMSITPMLGAVLLFILVSILLASSANKHALQK